MWRPSGLPPSVCNLACRHFQRVMHRDLKPSNVLVAAGGVAKIGDFGVSCILRGDDDTLTDVAGTPAFMAP